MRRATTKSSPIRRSAAVLALALLAALPAAPAGATEVDVDAPSCRTLLSTTPVVEVDADNDGNPEVRSPRIYDVTLCTDANASYTTYPPTIENCSPLPKQVTCMAVRITVLPAYASAYAYGEVCASIEGGGRHCAPVETSPWSWTRPRVVCVGYDLNGGHPCDGSLIAVD